MITEGLDAALHGLDAARRAGWRAFYEERQKVEALRGEVGRTTNEMFRLAVCLYDLSIDSGCADAVSEFLRSTSRYGQMAIDVVTERRTMCEDEPWVARLATANAKRRALDEAAATWKERP